MVLVVLLEMFQVEMVEIPQHWVCNLMVVEVEHIEILLVMLLLDPLVVLVVEEEHHLPELMELVALLVIRVEMVIVVLEVVEVVPENQEIQMGKDMVEMDHLAFMDMVLQVP